MSISGQLSAVVLCTGLFACMPPNEPTDPKYMDYDLTKVPYKLFKPDKSNRLHWDLEEISGLSYYRENMLLAVEDESGNVYVLDANTGDKIEKVKFQKGGDYEGIEYDEENIWVMESNGNFYSFQISDGVAINVQKFESDFRSGNDLEGLSYVNGSLIVAAKGDGSIEGINEKGKGIYRIREDLPEPLFFIEKVELEKFIKERVYFNKIADFDPSAIAVHPRSKDIYILSADHILVVYDNQLRLKEIVKLDKGIFTQPEGICFTPEGDMYISSEGNGDRGEIFQFKEPSSKN